MKKIVVSGCGGRLGTAILQRIAAREDCMVVAGVVGYFSIRLVNLLAAKGKFGAFAYYCWAAGIVALILSLMGWTML